MASPGQKNGSGLSIRTLAIAAASSAAAAVIVSHFWKSGTIFASAVTPVIVALISESLHRAPTTVVRTPTRRAEALPDAGGAAPPPETGPATPVPEQVGVGEMTVHQARRRIRGRVVAATAALAFLTAGVVLTVPELIFGDSVSGDRDTTFFGGRDRERKEAAPAETQTQTQTETVTVPAEPAPTETVPSEDELKRQLEQQQTQTAPAQTTPAPPEPPGEVPPAEPAP